jgi:hypothetical protein
VAMNIMAYAETAVMAVSVEWNGLSFFMAVVFWVSRIPTSFLFVVRLLHEVSSIKSNK